MNINSRHKKSRGPAARIGIGVTVSLILYLILAVISAAVLSRINNPIGGVGIASMISFFPTALISGFIISRMKGEGGVLTAGASALIFVLMMLLCCAVLTRGKIPISTAISYTAYVILAIMGGAFGKKHAKRRFRA